MTRAEQVWCWRFSVALIVLTALPYVMAYSSEGETWRFSGFLIGVEDGNSYIAKMRLGADGEWLFRTPYTTAPQRGALAFLPYLVLGKLAGGPGMHAQLVALFHGFRIASLPLLVFAVYCFASAFIEAIPWRQWVVVLSTLGGGLGWLLIALSKSGWLGSLPLDVHSPETFGFLAVFGLPHLVVARALMFWGLGEYIQSSREPARAWRAGAAWLGMGLFQPLALVSVYALLAAQAILLAGLTAGRRDADIARRWWTAGARAGIVPLPLLAYNLAAFSIDPFLSEWTAQNVILSPHPLHYLAAYGLLILPAAIGARDLTQRLGERAWLLVAWILALPALAYAPHNLQRRLPDGVWIAVLILGAAGLEAWGRRPSRIRAVRVGVGAVSLLTTALLLAGAVQTALHPSEPAFRPSGEVASILRLDQAAATGDVVLASYDTGNVLPAWASVHVVLGHGPESVGLPLAREAVERFFASSTSRSERLDILETYRVVYVFWGPHERGLGDWPPASADFLTPLAMESDYLVYEVTPP